MLRIKTLGNVPYGHEALYPTAEARRFYGFFYKRLKRMSAQSDGTVTQKYIKDLLEKTERCCICGGRMKASEKTIEHLQPLSKGGAHSVLNLGVSHLKCNIEKGAVTQGQLTLGMNKAGSF